jgi:hypothetical protein
MAPYGICRTPETGITGLPNSIRIPTTPENQRYLKLLREAEQARWRTTDAQDDVLTTRLPSVKDSRTERWLMRFVGVISLAAVGYAVMDSTRLVESWPAFAEWVKFAIGA